MKEVKAGNKINWPINMVLSQRVQSSQFDSQPVNAQCSDLSVSCVCAFQSNCMMKIPFPHLLVRP